MLLAHALTLTQARSCIAALADSATSLDASSAYEHVLIELDRIHHDTTPALADVAPPHDRENLHASATAAIKELAEHEIDPLLIELALIMLSEARDLDIA